MFQQLNTPIHCVMRVSLMLNLCLQLIPHENTDKNESFWHNFKLILNGRKEDLKTTRLK